MQNDDGTLAPPIMEMDLRKNKVNLCGHQVLPIICFASYSASSFLYYCQQAKILLEETLSFSPYGGNSNYHLRGVVHHIGNTAAEGHYTSCVKRIIKGTEGDSSDTTDAQDNKEQWVLFDDQKAKRRPASYVLDNESNQRNCYMALYAASDTGSDNTAHDDDESVKEAERTTTFEPVIQLEEVDVKSSTKEEEILHTFRAKLFKQTQLDKGTAEPFWKELGIGEARILLHRDRQQLRFLMQQEKTMKVIANHALDPSRELEPSAGSD